MAVGKRKIFMSSPHTKQFNFMEYFMMSDSNDSNDSSDEMIDIDEDNETTSQPCMFPIIFVTTPTNVEHRDGKISFQRLGMRLLEYEVQCFHDGPDLHDLELKEHAELVISINCTEKQNYLVLCNKIVNIILHNIYQQLTTNYSKGCTGCRYCTNSTDEWSSYQSKMKWYYYHKLQSVVPGSVKEYVSLYRKTGCHFDIHVSLYQYYTFGNTNGYTKKGSWTFSKNLEHVHEADNSVNILIKDE